MFPNGSEEILDLENQCMNGFYTGSTEWSWELNLFKINKIKLTSASSSLDENCPVVPMIIFLMQNDPSWNLQRRKEYILCLDILDMFRHAFI